MRAERDWSALGSWGLGFLPVAYLGLEGGGYDPLVHDQVGIAVWWILLATVAVGALPRREVGRLALAALGLLAAFVAWTALSLAWTESPDKTWGELSRVLLYLGAFALATLAAGPGHARRLAAGVATAIVSVSVVALLSRLQPGMFPEATETARFLAGGRERLSFPLNYWNALAALIAIGFPLVLLLAAGARSLATRGLAAAALPAMGLTAYFTLSRSGIAAALLAVALFLALTSDRLPKLATALLCGGGGAVLIALAAARDALQEGLPGATAERQGDEMLALTLIVCVAVGALQVGASAALRGRDRPGWRASPRRSALAAALLALATLSTAAALGAPGRASDGWREFKRAEGPGSGAARLGSAAGQGRYQLWVAAVEQSAGRPLSGRGAGTYEFWWARNGDDAGTVLDAHSLYLQTLGELGIVGIALLGSFFLVVLAGGAREAIRAGPASRGVLAAAAAGCAAFCVAVVFDWHWQIPAVPIAMLLLGAVLVAARAEDRQAAGSAALRPAARIGFAAIAILAIVAIAIPLAATSRLRDSEAAARRGDLLGALRAARTAQNVHPGMASPRLQQALLLERLGSLSAAATAAGEATAREPTNWRHWLTLSRIEARRGRPAAAIAAYRRARSLNPHFSIFRG